MRDFDEWLQTMRPSINTFKFYVDFEKVYRNVDNIRIELNIMNSLIGSKNVHEDFKSLVAKYPEILKCIPILLAVRSNEIFVQDESRQFNFNFTKPNYSIEEYEYFMEQVGLFDLIANHLVNNLVDYAMGVETGLDSNGRKNRGGHQMEDLVESFLKKADVEYYKEMYLTEIEKKWGVNLAKISADGTSTKRWDFVVKTPDTIYVIETNFYSGGGSKLNETSRSYKMIAEEVKEVDGVEFVWVTDGLGWRNTRRNLAETFHVLDTIYNISDLENGCFDTLFHK